MLKSQSIHAFDDYQVAAHATAVYPAGLMYYPVLGLVGEAGELYASLLEPEEFVIKEAGDVLWYCAEICTSRGRDLQDCFNGVQLSVRTVSEAVIRVMLAASRIAETYKKAIRSGHPAPDFCEGIAPGISIILAAVSFIAAKHGLIIYDVMERNIEKLATRAADGELKERKQQ